MVINKSVEFVKMITINIIKIMVFITCVLAFSCALSRVYIIFLLNIFLPFFDKFYERDFDIYSNYIQYQLNDYDNTITIIITLITTMMMMMIRFGVYVRR